MGNWWPDRGPPQAENFGILKLIFRDFLMGNWLPDRGPPQAENFGILRLIFRDFLWEIEVVPECLTHFFSYMPECLSYIMPECLTLFSSHVPECLTHLCLSA